MDAVVPLGRRHRASQFARNVGTQFAADPEAPDVVAPDFESLPHAAVLRIVDDGAESMAEIGVARHHDGLLQVERARMGVAPDGEPSCAVAVVTGVARLGADDPFLQAYQGVDQFEDGTRRLGRLHGPVEHRSVGVGDQLVVVLVDLRQVGDVDSRAGNHGQNIPGGGFNGYERPHFVLHQLLAESLQRGVDGGVDIGSGHRGFVVAALLVALHDPVVYVAVVDGIALLAAQRLFKGLLHAGLAGVVAAAVFGILFDVVRVHFGDIAQQIPAGVVVVGPGGTRNAVEPRKAFQLLGKDAVLLRRNLLEQHLRLVSDLPAVEPPLPEAGVDVGRVDIENPAEGHRIEGLLDDGRGDQDVVGDLVAHDDTAVAVADQAAGRVAGLVFESVVLRVDAVFAVDDLDIEELAYDDGEHREDGGDQDNLAVGVTVHISSSPAGTDSAARPVRHSRRQRAPSWPEGRRPAGA